MHIHDNRKPFGDRMAAVAKSAPAFPEEGIQQHYMVLLILNDPCENCVDAFISYHTHMSFVLPDCVFFRFAVGSIFCTFSGISRYSGVQSLGLPLWDLA